MPIYIVMKGKNAIGMGWGAMSKMCEWSGWMMDTPDCSSHVRLELV